MTKRSVGLALLMSKVRTIQSSPPVAASLPSGEMATARTTAPWLSWAFWATLAVAALQTRADVSRLAVASLLPTKERETTADLPTEKAALDTFGRRVGGLAQKRTLPSE